MGGISIRVALAGILFMPVSPVQAQAGNSGVSACAALPESGPVARPGPDVVTPAIPTADRNWACEPGARRDLAARVPRCIAPGIKVADGNPRTVCYAAMPFGPIAPIAQRMRPTATCATSKTTTIIALRGAGLGFADAGIAVVPANGITLTPLAETGAKIPVAENPVLQGCFAFDCRLVKLEITSRAAPVVEVRISLPGRDPVVQDVALQAGCAVLRQHAMP